MPSLFAQIAYAIHNTYTAYFDYVNHVLTFCGQQVSVEMRYTVMENSDVTIMVFFPLDYISI